MKRVLPRWILSLLLGASPVLAADRPPLDRSTEGTPVVLADPQAGGRSQALVASVDDRRGVPTFLWGARQPSAATTFEGAAMEQLAQHAAHYGLPPEALASAAVERVLDTGRGGVVAVVKQRIHGVEIFHTSARVLLDRERRLVAIGGGLHGAAFPGAKHGKFILSNGEAAAIALGDLLGLSVAPSDLEERGARGDYRGYALREATAKAAGLKQRAPTRVKRVYFPVGERLRAGYFLEIDAVGPNREPWAYAYVIDATDGSLLYRSNLTHSATYSYRVWAQTDGDKRPMDGPLADLCPYPADTPQEITPAPAAPSLVSIDGFNGPKDPWLPEGATETAGNNVDAYTDDDQPDGFSLGDTRASVTSPQTFDRVYDTTKGPASSDEQRMASVTSIFYTTNWLHDWWYDSGFNEKGDNAQKDNYGRGGLGGDPLLAEAQNGSPFQRNNANMSAFGDGLSPRMQMFVWDSGTGSAAVTLLADNKELKAGVATFGPQDFELEGEVVAMDDGVDPIGDACESAQNDLQGKIALIDRGTCTFQSKALIAQNAGAKAVLLVNNKASKSPPTMPGDGPTKVSIPVLSLLQVDGQAIQASLASGPVSVKMKRIAAVDADGTIDNSVVSHEWGHYLHLRNVYCGSASCFAQSEGWGDFVALMLSVREGDPTNGIFPLAQYASLGLGQNGDYFGIRRYPYSTDQQKNPLTFRHIESGVPLPDGPPVNPTALNDNAEAHAAGEVWAAMMFEAYTSLIQRSESPEKPYTFQEAQRRMGDYVVQGMTMAPPNPTYTEQRDAILAAAAARDEEDVKVMAAAFARRGAGTCAVSPPRESIDFKGVIESFEVQPSVRILSISVNDALASCDDDKRLDSGEQGQVKIKVQNVGTSAVKGAKATVASTTEGALFPAGTELFFPEIPPFGTTEGVLPIALAAGQIKQGRVDLSVDIQNVVVCAEGSKLSASLLSNYDEIKTGATVDSVEATNSAFSPKGKSSDQIWSRQEISPGNHAWVGIDYGSPSDTMLISPPVTVSETDPLVFSFKHRYQFETSNDIFWDGSLIELSSDGGKTWVDIATLGDPGYNGTIGDPNLQATNALRGREGFVDHNPSFPELDEVKIDLGTKLAGKTVQVRFRIGTDDAAGNLGWQLDDIGFTGITNAPFSGTIDNQTVCDKLDNGAGGAAGQGGNAASGAAGDAANNPAGSAGNNLAGSTSGAGFGGASGAAGTGVALAEGPITPGGGCDCKASPGSGQGSGGILVALAALAARRRRKG